MDAGNGANFGLVPHVHPYANGIVSGLVGATGNFGGIIGAIIFRYSKLFMWNHVRCSFYSYFSFLCLSSSRNCLRETISENKSYTRS